MKKRVKKEGSKKLLLLHTFTLDQGRGGSNANRQSNFLAPLRKLSHVNASKLVKKTASLRPPILHRPRRRQSQHIIARSDSALASASASTASFAILNVAKGRCALTRMCKLDSAHDLPPRLLCPLCQLIIAEAIRSMPDPHRGSERTKLLQRGCK